LLSQQQEKKVSKFPHPHLLFCLKGTSSILTHDGIDKVDGDSPTGADAARMSTTTSASAPETQEDADESLDLAMETILQDSNMQVFACLDDVSSIVSSIREPNRQPTLNTLQ
jgi:hypothetical protein